MRTAIRLQMQSLEAIISGMFPYSANTKLYIPIQDGSATPAVKSGTGTITNYYGSPVSGAGARGKCLTYNSSATPKQAMKSNVIRSGGNLSGLLIMKGTPTAANQYLMSNIPISNNNGFRLGMLPSGKLFATIWDNSAAENKEVISTGVASAWSFAGFSVNAATKKISLKLNSEFLETVALVGGYGVNNTPVELFSYGGGGYYNGQAAFLYIADHAITQAEFAELHTRISNVYPLG